MKLMNKDPEGRFERYETVCLPDRGDGVIEAAAIIGFTEKGYAVQKGSGLQSIEQTVMKPEEAFPWAANALKKVRAEREEQNHLEWLLSQKVWVSDLLMKCPPSDFINRMSLKSRLESVEAEIEAIFRKRNGQMA